MAFQRKEAVVLSIAILCMTVTEAQGDGNDLEHDHGEQVHSHDHDHEHDHEHDHDHDHDHEHDHNHDHEHDHDHDHDHNCCNHDHDHDHDHNVRMAQSPDFELDFDVENLHHRYNDVIEHEEHKDEEDVDFDIIFTEWPRLLQFPEIRNPAQLKAVTNEEFRQARHVFIYFADVHNIDCYHQIDDINLAYSKAVASYGVDSVMFYKVFGGLFAQDFNIHTYPTIVYIDSPEDLDTIIDSKRDGLNLKRLTGATITENQLSQLVFDCVEGNYDETHMESYARWLDQVGRMNEAELAPEVLLHDLRMSYDEAEYLKDYAKMSKLQAEVSASLDFEEVNELALQVLIG